MAATFQMLFRKSCFCQIRIRNLHKTEQKNRKQFVLEMLGLCLTILKLIAGDCSFKWLRKIVCNLVNKNDWVAERVGWSAITSTLIHWKCSLLIVSFNKATSTTKNRLNVRCFEAVISERPTTSLLSHR